MRGGPWRAAPPQKGALFFDSITCILWGLFATINPGSGRKAIRPRAGKV